MRDTTAPLTACLPENLGIVQQTRAATHQNAKHHEWMAIPELIRSGLAPRDVLIDKPLLLDVLLGRSLGQWRFDVSSAPQ